MFNLILLLIITILLGLICREVFSGRLERKVADYNGLRDELNRLNDSKKSLSLKNNLLSNRFDDTLALYELTKDISQSLDEEKIFLIFKKNLIKHIDIGDCRYIKDSADLIKYKNYLIQPLSLEDDKVAGYLAVERILEADKEKFGILAQQFLIGLRRALFYQKVQSLTITDTLTNIYCRKYFLERFSEELKRSRKNKLRLSFLMIDIDNFKQFNDHYGHLVGDAILRRVAKTILLAVRQIDFAGRYGGEEISVVLAETNKQQASFAAERIRQSIAAQIVKAYDEELKVTVSIGVSIFPDNALNTQNLVDLADQALYLAKESGKNKVCFPPA
ncbi:MAG: GGDEF domain-containing protein [Candidatus Omnitrophota bacterium]